MGGTKLIQFLAPNYSLLFRSNLIIYICIARCIWNDRDEVEKLANVLVFTGQKITFLHQ